MSGTVVEKVLSGGRLSDFLERDEALDAIGKLREACNTAISEILEEHRAQFPAGSAPGDAPEETTEEGPEGKFAELFRQCDCTWDVRTSDKNWQVSGYYDSKKTAVHYVTQAGYKDIRFPTGDDDDLELDDDGSGGRADLYLVENGEWRMLVSDEEKTLDEYPQFTEAAEAALAAGYGEIRIFC